MCHLVTDASEAVPQMAYKMLREAAHKRTEHLVVEASIEAERGSFSHLPERRVPGNEDNDGVGQDRGDDGGHVHCNESVFQYFTAPCFNSLIL